MKNNKRYFAESNSFVRERFSGVDGFNNFSDADIQFSNAAGAPSAGAPTSMPYEVEVANSTAGTLTATIWNSYINRLAANNGNPVGITITSATPGIPYAAMLASSEHKNFEIGKTYIEVVSGSNSVVTATWSLTTGDIAGELTTKPVVPKLSPNQQLGYVLDFYYTFKINGYCNIQVNIPANTTVRYSFYPSATIDPGRKLGNIPETREYADAKITRPEQLTLSPAALAALRG